MEVKIDGLTALIEKLDATKYSGKQVRTIVQKNGVQLQTKTQDNMLNAYTGHMSGKKFVKPTGATRRSVALDIKDGGMTAEVAPGTKYFPYLEYGTRFMDARPTLKPAFEMVATSFQNDLKDLFK